MLGGPDLDLLLYLVLRVARESPATFHHILDIVAESMPHRLRTTAIEAEGDPPYHDTENEYLSNTLHRVTLPPLLNPASQPGSRTIAL